MIPPLLESQEWHMKGPRSPKQWMSGIHTYKMRSNTSKRTRAIDAKPARIGHCPLTRDTLEFTEPQPRLRMRLVGGTDSPCLLDTFTCELETIFGLP